MLDYLRTPQAREKLRELSTQPLGPQAILKLRKNADAATRLLIEVAANRQKLKGRIADPDRFFALGEGAEQLTATPVARWRAARMDRVLPQGKVLELGCGLGGDLLEMARYREVVAWERDPQRLQLARLNLEAADLAHRVEFCLGDWREAELPQSAGVFVDPVRRRAGRRVFDPEKCDPPLSSLRQRFRATHLVVKTAPGMSPVPNAEVEYVSLDGALKEATLWCSTRVGEGRRATRLGWSSTPRSTRSQEIPLDNGCAPDPPFFLHEPDPSAIRAGLLGQLCREAGLCPLDPQIAYLWSRQPVEHPWLTSFRVTHRLEYKTKILARSLAELGVGRLEIKKRGVDLDPDQLRKKLKLKGSHGGVLFLTRRGNNERLVYLAQRCERFGVVD